MCTTARTAGDFVQIKVIMRKKKYNSILQKHAIPSGCHIIRQNFVCNKIMVQNTAQNCVQIIKTQKKIKNFCKS